MPMGLCLRRLVLQYPSRGGRFQPESVAAFNRNQWQPSPGIGGRFRPESVATFAWNRWQVSTGISGNLRPEYARNPLLNRTSLNRSMQAFRQIEGETLHLLFGTISPLSPLSYPFISPRLCRNQHLFLVSPL